MRKGVTQEELEDNLAKMILVVESELHFPIGEDYPLLKFFSEWDNLSWYKELQSKAAKQKDKKGFGLNG